MPRNVPTPVAGLAGIPAVFAACGKVRVTRRLAAALRMR
jgi:hypothetical protein